MDYVRIEKTDAGYLLDPNGYLNWLNESPRSLPTGAMTFATDPGHYDIHSPRCVKDLRPTRMQFAKVQDSVNAELLLSVRGSDRIGWQLQYMNVSIIAARDRSGDHLDLSGDAGIRRLGDVQLDEILPHVNGCRHEVSFLAGILVVVAADIHAKWIDGQSGSETVVGAG